MAQYVKVRDKDGNKIEFKTTPRDPEERRSFPLSFWRKTALDRIQLPNGTSVAVDLPLPVIQDKNRPERMDWTDFEHLKSKKPTAAQTLITDCPECAGTGHVGDEDVADVELCPLCGGLGRIMTHFGSEVIKFMEWLDNPPHVIDEKGVARMNAVNSLKREAAAKKKAASKRLGGDNLDWKKEMGGQKAIAEYQSKMSIEAQRIDAELEAALKALDEKA
jgi:hypothetical protein